jgi:hypothetical protein
MIVGYRAVRKAVRFKATALPDDIALSQHVDGCSMVSMCGWFAADEMAKRFGPRNRIFLQR